MAAGRTTAIVALVALVVGVTGCRDGASAEVAPRVPAVAAATPAAKQIPHLVDLGAGKCIPCKAMAPILDQLRADYAGSLQVTFIDVWKEPERARAYGIKMIPTQIFYGPDGRELARHEGFIDREGILATWMQLGVAVRPE